MASDELAARWFALTKEDMPAVAAKRGWPVRFDHCFQRILLDNAVGCAWRERIASPVYRNVTDGQLARAIELGEECLAGTQDLHALNRHSLKWRGKG